ncbi:MULTISPECIES: dynamin family protein [unclassified Campylobacter]|uniref:dynamin family protein n=1 Tax=unclassified Campylobacter TaxID=2593542 RepID=UPI001237B6C3|nr:MULTISPECIES: dynamin family protein [unclassified Campylobacter]KAA6227333.1 ATP-binding protein [Campylobacter sp. LR286c]KAA6227792.1 ATP-binding protein [Campylobacter sp. LR185c]KAA6228200.1 ATP-binding protein [Campylobacter sp. LR196d]KAA6229200.1 ATP-binding protein [Campylobacter sp. LR291e]KAA6231005.1 ATP-binding protein [Campylobacter sp. LR264d]
MQIKILNDFINAYNNAFEVKFDESFKGQINALCKRLKEPFMHLSKAMTDELDELLFSLDKNVNIAIIGQFSSGKSSLLNLLLKKECLPTGVIPVTFKPTFLHFGKDYFLRIKFKDGSDKVTDISELASYTDQRQSNKEATSLHIYAPATILQEITLVDTPGLNANDTDTLTTMKELSNTHAVVWLSLIDNAGKKSEEDAIKANLELLGGQSICVLNQKDKLNESELNNVLNYAKGVFNQYFKEVIAISCKEAKEEKSYEKSNFPLLLKYFENLDKKSLKENFTKRKMLYYTQILENETRLFEEVFTRLQNEFKDFESYLKEYFKNLLERVEILSHQLLDKLKSISERISTEIFSYVKEKDAHFYKEAKGFLKNGLFIKYDYKSPYISSDDAFLAMFYNSDIMSKEFKKTKNELGISFENLKSDLRQGFEKLHKDILLFKARFSNLQKDNFLQSEINFSELRAFANASDEYFLKDFEKALFKHCLEIDIFFEKLNLKAFANYENATKLSLSFFSRKINESRAFYELDSTQFSLFYPKKSEIYERVLTELNVYEFEALLISKPVITKIIKSFFNENFDIISQKNSFIDEKKSELNKRLSLILSIKKDLENL